MSSIKSVATLSLSHPHLRRAVPSTSSIHRVLNRKPHTVTELIAPELPNVDEWLLVGYQFIVSEAGEMSEVQKGLIEP